MSNNETGGVRLGEFTLKAVGLGLLFGVVFGAANAYLGLRAGLTVSTSIPIAVLTAVTFRALRRPASILELNMAQTVGSASSSLAAGTIFTIPALFMWGGHPGVVETAVLAALGGFLGILAMIPLRRLLIVQADGELPYPEGRACAEVLRASEGESSQGKWIVIGLCLGAAMKILVSGMHICPEDLAFNVAALKNGEFAVKVAPALIAVGFIVGFRASAVMIAGSLITAFVLIPFGSEVFTKTILDAGVSAKSATAGDMRRSYITFFGAGSVAAAGMITVVRTAPTMVQSFLSIVRSIKGRTRSSTGDRTDRDVSPRLLVLGFLILAAVMILIPGIFAGGIDLKGRVIAAVGVLVFGFIFVPVSSRLVGVIGVSSNPTSAMALISMVGTAALFVAAGYGGTAARATILTVGTVVCVAASKAGDISQDLKTGFLVRGTPALQQYGQMIAAATACWAVAAVVIALGNGPDAFGSDNLKAPQATLMKTVIDSVLGEKMPWNLVLAGASLSGIGFLAGLPALPLALGVYLPLSTMATVFIGGSLRRAVEAKTKEKDGGVESGILCASGFVAGEGLAGVGIAAWAFIKSAGRYQQPEVGWTEKSLGLALIAVASIVLVLAARRRSVPA